MFDKWCQTVQEIKLVRRNVSYSFARWQHNRIVSRFMVVWFLVQFYYISSLVFSKYIYVYVNSLKKKNSCFKVNAHF